MQNSEITLIDAEFKWVGNFLIQLVLGFPQIDFDITCIQFPFFVVGYSRFHKPKINLSLLR